ncbi:MAG: UDP-N-acetylmuramoyl-L-alanyl-D-glutamate--2,6-diaminopimelate ligase [Steroidobacteraceae bacterium]|jgi:UDP-N-acetylmuramoyl-L-alanyl-D-glutamate--2,6-diaminopimelate ligase|nr:UDP-N-acetylmuramoyl-L-alanyl-D-glutamate--2,6-diaminopimelate ligase [Steroidobacteraceae bacterium]
MSVAGAAGTQPPRELAALLEGLAAAPAGLVVADVTLDSRRARRDGLFLACAGRRTHGLVGAAAAVDAGVRAVLWEPAAGVEPPAGLDSRAFVAPVPGLSRHAGAIAARFFDAPSRAMTVAGITGTNGKTTSCWLLAQALHGLGRPCGYVGTLGAGLPPGPVEPGEFTTADAVSVQRQLAALRAAGARCVAMEVSSHALDQHRVGGVEFRVAAFTNLTRDHLDYHGTMEAYGAAKARLFDWPGLGARVFNVDDAFGARLAGSALQAGSVTFAVARQAASRALLGQLRAAGARALQAGAVRSTSRGLEFRVEGGFGARELRLPLVGDFNVENALVVLGCLLALDVPVDAAIEALARCGAPSGRMETLGGGERPLAIVDYAHTPDALAKALRAARAHCSGRLHVVFGCGGDRDPGKRPQMGAIAAQLADALVVTDDNPRTESPQRIVADILAGLPGGAGAEVVHDRAEAIRATLARARPGDVVLVAGKGHEDYQFVGAERRPFSDQAEVRAALGLVPVGGRS